MFQELKRIKKSTAFQPRPEWFFNTRQELVRKVEMTSVETKPKWNLTWLEFKYSFVQFSPKLVSFIVVFGLIGGVVVKANAQYRPDSIFYTAKTALERIRLVVALTPSDEAKVLIDHSKRRQEEVKKLAEDKTLKPEEKAKMIGEVVKSLEQKLTSAKTSLEIVNSSKEESSKEAAGQIAKEVSGAAKDAASSLIEVQKQLVATVLPAITATSTQSEVKDAKDAKDQVVKTLQDMSTAVTAVSDVETKSLKILVDKVENKEINNVDNKNKLDNISAKEVKDLLTDKMNRVEAKVDQVAAVIDSAAAIKTDLKKEEIKEIKSVFPVTTLPKEVVSSSPVVVLDQKEVKEAAAQSDKAKDAIGEAKKELSKTDNLTAAFNKIEQAEKISTVSQTTIEKATAVTPATSTVSQIDKNKK